MDKNFIVFMAITSTSYPESSSTQFLKQLSEQLYNSDPVNFKRKPQLVDQLDNSLKFNIYDLHSKYKDPSDVPSQSSGVRRAQNKIDEATSLMKKNIGSMLNNRD